MAKGFDLEFLRDILQQKQLGICVGIIEKLVKDSDNSQLRVLVNCLPDEIPMWCRMSWEATGPDAGIFQFPQAGDMVLVGYAYDDENQAFVLKRLTSKGSKIPVQAVSGDTVVKALAGKQGHLLSDTKILIGRGGADPSEPTVLGAIFQAAYSEHLEKYIAHKHIGNLGYFTAVPDNAADVAAIKASPVDDDEMLSDHSFVEK